VAAAVDSTPILQGELQGAEIGAAIRQLRIAAISRYKQQYLEQAGLANPAV